MISAEIYYTIALPLITIAAIASTWNAVLQTVWYRRAYRDSKE
jgi:hypothetical protein